MSNTLSPRPILKRSCSAERGPSPQNAVHFPPSPSLTRTFSVHSAASYDRSPIVVDANTCALPERGCPGRTYGLDDTPHLRQKAPPSRGHAHPRAWLSTMPPPPPLMLDLSSESDESDGLASPPLFPFSSTPSLATDAYIAHAASFPYSSSSPGFSSLPSTPLSEPSFRRRKSSSYMTLDDDPGYDDDDDTPTPTSSPIVEKRRSKKVAKMFSKKMSSFGLEDDDGCLGGF